MAEAAPSLSKCTRVADGAPAPFEIEIDFTIVEAMDAQDVGGICRTCLTV